MSVERDHLPEGKVELKGEAFAFRRLVQLGDASSTRSGSIDEPLSAAMSDLLGSCR